MDSTIDAVCQVNRSWKVDISRAMWIDFYLGTVFSIRQWRKISNIDFGYAIWTVAVLTQIFYLKNNPEGIYLSYKISM